MNTEVLAKLLADVQGGALSVEEALARLKDLPFADLGFAKVDKHRAHRQGFPEVIYGAGKTFDQIVSIAASLGEDSWPVLITRVQPEQGAKIAAAIGGVFHEMARAVVVTRGQIEDRGRGEIVVVAAGTSDLPVAEEARLTAEVMGNRTRLITDVGVAGLHRILAQRQHIEEAEVVIVVAGMEGALPSVVGGLTSRPLIAVPTSVGYGAAFGGLAALLGMLNSCAAGVTVVNIDNGFGAGFAASRINRRRATP
jgi:hypothetical protein